MEAALQAYMALEPGSPHIHSARQQLLESLGPGGVVVNLVKLLKDHLINDADDAGRCKAVQVLADVTAEAGEQLTGNDVHHLAAFFASKLGDWPCLEPVCRGCEALLRRREHSQWPQLSDTDAMNIMQAFAEETAVPAQTQGKRSACLSMWQAALQHYGTAAVQAGIDITDITTAAIDEERDPRPLVQGWACVRTLAAVFDTPGTPKAPLQAGAQLLFEAAVASYFPLVVAKDERGAGGGLQEMRGQLEATMACAREFAPCAVALLEEKLGSSLRAAKEASLSALPVCCRQFGPDVMRSYLPTVWLMLKQELMAPAASPAEALAGHELAAKQEVARLAATSLAKSIAALGAGELDAQVLADVCMEDLAEYVGLGAAPPGPLSGRAARRLRCIAAIAAAVAAGGPDSCTALCTQLLQPLAGNLAAATAAFSDTDAQHSSSTSMSSAPPSPEHITGQLCVLHASIEAAAAAATEQAWAACPALAALAGPVVSALEALLTHSPGAAAAIAASGDATSSGEAYEPMEEDEGEGAASASEAGAWEQVRIWALKLWGALLACPPAQGLLQQEGLAVAATRLAVTALQGSLEEVPLVLDWGGLGRSEAGEALAGLRQLAGLAAGGAAAAVVVDAAMVVDGSDGVDGNRAAAAGNRAMAAGNSAVAAGNQQGAAATSASTAAGALAECVAPRLGAALGQGGSRGRALQVLVQLASSGAEVARHVLTWLQPLVEAKLDQGLSGAKDQALVAGILQLYSDHILPALPPVDSSSDRLYSTAEITTRTLGSFGACCSRRSSAAGGVSPDLQHSAARAVAQLVARGSEVDQKPWALEACGALAAAAARLTADTPAHSHTPGALDTAGASRTPSAAEGTGLSLRVVLASAVVAALRPAVLHGPSVADLTLALVQLATNGQLPDAASGAAAVALAAVVNKWQESASGAAASGVDGGQQLGQVVEQLLDGHLLPLTSWGTMDAGAASLSQRQQQEQQQQQQQQDEDEEDTNEEDEEQLHQQQPWLQLHRQGQRLRHPHQHQQGQQQGQQMHGTPAPVRVHAAVALSWVSRALAMRSSNLLRGILQHTCRQLRASTSSDHTAQLDAGGHGAAKAALAGLFAVLVADEAACAGLCLSPAMHTRAKVLWQQRALSFALSALEQELAAAPSEAGLEAAAVQGNGMHTDQHHQQHHQQQQQQQQQQAAVGELALLQAACSLITAAPAGLLKSSGSPIAALLVRCLRQLPSAAPTTISSSDSAAGQHTQQLLGCLRLLSTFLADTQLKQQLHEHVDDLLPALLVLAALPGAAAVREGALLALVALMKLPYHLLHPHRQKVQHAAAAALDDNKRVVRIAAVQCRRTWK